MAEKERQNDSLPSDRRRRDWIVCTPGLLLQGLQEDLGALLGYTLDCSKIS
jgi:hypothetical protein